ncbi:MAG: hypothetical protein CMP35_02115 [Rickettsiales bacterium]|nr:hypothetical protein [Rickettsiales bacterium]|tara:strand:- start:3646 stop:4215 length:570 start_codon:yes stop_codon:yes gene_type:complete
MRIISGEKKGHSFYSYKSKDVRPLSDKNRETIFNIILHGKEIIQSNFELDNCRIIELFAGTGSFSFEALSRGARNTTMVENNEMMIDMIYKSANKLGYLNKISVLNSNACSFEEDSINPKFNLVFIDPPYNKNLGKRSIKNLIKKNLLEKNSLIILEEELRSSSVQLSEIELLRIKKLGNTKFSFFKLI